MKATSKDVLQEAGSSIQDAWTVLFCKKFRQLRVARVIPSNRIFAVEIGVDQTALSHILRGRNFPKKHRQCAESVLARYEHIRSQINNTTSQIAATEDLACKVEQVPPMYTLLRQKRAQLHKEISDLRNESQKLQQEIAVLKDKVINLQAIAIQRLETLSPEGPSSIEAAERNSLDISHD
jgi:hypothetical protein